MITRIVNTLRWLNENKRKSKKSKLWILMDYYKLRKKYKVNKLEYSNYKLHSASENFRDTFLPYAKAEEYWEILNPRKYAVLARDKFIGHMLLSKIGVSTAKLYFAYDRETAGANDKLILHDVDQVIENIKHLNIDAFVAKPAADSAHGKGVGVYKVADIVEFGGTEIKMADILSCGKMEIGRASCRERVSLCV